MARAHQTAEQIRAQFGYSGGEDGSLYVPYQTAPAYQPAVQQPMWDTSGWGAGSSSGVSQAQAEAQALYEQQLAEFERAREAEQRALQAEIDRTLLALSAQIPGIERSAADANAAAYETWLRATNPFGAAAQRQSQLGLLNSGYSESSLASLGNTYQSVVGQNEQARVDSLRQIDLAREQTRLEGGIEKANQMAEFAKLIAQQRFNQGSALLDAAVQDRQLGLSQQQFAYEMGLAQRRLAYETCLLYTSSQRRGEQFFQVHSGFPFFQGLFLLKHGRDQLEIFTDGQVLRAVVFAHAAADAVGRFAPSGDGAVVVHGGEGVGAELLDKVVDGEQPRNVNLHGAVVDAVLTCLLYTSATRARWGAPIYQGG